MPELKRRAHGLSLSLCIVSDRAVASLGALSERKFNFLF